jgi:hypothetical protein
VSDGGTVPAELPLLMGPGQGEPERLMLLGAPVNGRVVIREWSGDDWSASATSRTEDADALMRWIEAQAAAGRTLNQSLYGVRLWLRDLGTAPRSR